MIPFCLIVKIRVIIKVRYKCIESINKTDIKHFTIINKYTVATSIEHKYKVITCIVTHNGKLYT